MGENQGNQQRRKNKVFSPVTMKMIAEAQPRPDDVCDFDGEPINDIIIVGRVTQRYEETMRTLFEINDNTGTFKVIFYQKGENETPIALKNFNYQQFMYVKVYGTIRVFKEEKAIVGTHIKKIEKYDEITNHLLQVFVAHCIRKEGVLTNKDLQGQQQAQHGGQSHSTTNMLAASHSNTDSKQQVLQVMKEIGKNSNKFIHKNDIYSVVQQYMNF